MLAAMGAAALRTVLLAGMVRLCLRLARVRRPRLLLATWTIVLLASLAMPALQRSVTVSIPRAITLPLAAAGLSALREAPMLPAPALSPARDGGGGRLPSDWRWWLTGLYGAAAGVMLLRLALGVGLSARLLWRAESLPLSRSRGMRARVSPDVNGPVTLGSTVLLPLDCETWPEDRWQAVMAHEGAHASGDDFYVLLLSQVNRAVFWFSPLSWWLHRRLAMLAELASDDVAVAALGNRAGYARALLDIARRPGVSSIGVAMARPATVERRIERVLAGGETPASVAFLERAGVAAGVFCLALLAAVSVTWSASDSGALVAAPPAYASVRLDPALLDRYAGFYRDPRNGSIMVVTRAGDHLATHRAGHPPVPEYPYSERDFYLTTVPQQNSFMTDASGLVVGVVHHQEGRDESLERISDQAGRAQVADVERHFAAERAPHYEQQIDTAVLDGYAGAYALSPQLMVIVSRDGDGLNVQLTGRPSHQFRAYGTRDFFSANAAAQISFVLGPDGTASAFVLHQGGRDRAADRVDPALARALNAQAIAGRQTHEASDF